MIVEFHHSILNLKFCQNLIRKIQNVKPRDKINSKFTREISH